ncbi:hypothetical protein NQX30_07470 [Candidatus Persebacteraceae bacterium Df01]|jgi:hypothetical protein|uniref:Uncharacterized protein n=1 Tax=Candidatus Doriopsillibacter californiensis TaxID=2970740 RepID=A0ABT7QNC4_9GAMM|nr:hypothetical protein [Candidatus Persebacteraceae bacterium Df01]
MSHEFLRRGNFGAVFLNGTMYIMGGIKYASNGAFSGAADNDFDMVIGALVDDLWWSTDGRTWTQVDQSELIAEQPDDFGRENGFRLGPPRLVAAHGADCILFKVCKVERISYGVQRAGEQAG